MATTSEVFLTSIKRPHSADHEENDPDFDQRPDSKASDEDDFSQDSDDNIFDSALGSIPDDEQKVEPIIEDKEEEPVRKANGNISWLQDLAGDSDEYDTELEDDFPPGERKNSF